MSKGSQAVAGRSRVREAKASDLSRRVLGEMVEAHHEAQLSRAVAASRHPPGLREIIAAWAEAHVAPGTEPHTALDIQLCREGPDSLVVTLQSRSPEGDALLDAVLDIEGDPE